MNPDLTYWLSTRNELGSNSIVNAYIYGGYPTVVVIGKDYKVIQVTNGNISEDTVRRAISDMPSSNTDPVADAGQDQNVGEKILVALDGTYSKDNDDCDRIDEYSWRQTSGTTVTLSDLKSGTPDFTTPFTDINGATLQFELTVTDTHGVTDTDTCIVTVQNTMNPPVADAGIDQDAGENVSVRLDGSGSRDNDPGDSIAQYLWTQISGTSVTLSNAAAVNPDFVSPNVGVDGESLKFLLTVTDTSGQTDTDECIINVLSKSPIPDAGNDQTVVERSTVRLNGSNSRCFDAGNSVTSYQWSQKSGAVMVTLLDSNNASPTFTAPGIGAGGMTLEFDLTITCNGIQASDSCLVTITNGGNLSPEAHAGYNPMINIKEDVTVTLTGELSTDPDGNDDIATYSWRQVRGADVTLSCTDCVEAEFIAPGILTDFEELEFILTVTDKEGLSSESACIVTLASVNSAPVSIAGFAVEFKEPFSNVVANSNETLTLTGLSSYDPDGSGDMASYSWVQTKGRVVDLSCLECMETEFITPEVDGAHESIGFKLTVKDKSGLESESLCTVQVMGQDEEWACFINSL